MCPVCLLCFTLLSHCPHTKAASPFLSPTFTAGILFHLTLCYLISLPSKLSVWHYRSFPSLQGRLFLLFPSPPLPTIHTDTQCSLPAQEVLGISLSYHDGSSVVPLLLSFHTIILVTSHQGMSPVCIWLLFLLSSLLLSHFLLFSSWVLCRGLQFALETG